jgi:allophanate hydrolase
MTLRVLDIGPAVAVQDMGRPGLRAQGLTTGGAADRLALYEGAALLGQTPDCAVLEMAGLGGRFQADESCAIALTGGQMTATLDGAPLAWNASHALATGAILEIGAARSGSYSYLHVSGGFQTPILLGARASHLSAGIGHLVQVGDVLPAGPAKDAGLTLPHDTRFNGGTLRVVPSMQTHMFSEAQRARFEATAFRRAPRANRQGVPLTFDGESFAPVSARSIVSEAVVSGDVQITGDGSPKILLTEGQTTGGYPRIGTVLPCDIPRAAQCPAGGALRFTFVTLDDARRIEAQARKDWATLNRRVMPLVRNPGDMADLLSYTLISGAVTGDEP